MDALHVSSVYNNQTQRLIAPTFSISSAYTVLCYLVMKETRGEICPSISYIYSNATKQGVLSWCEKHESYAKKLEIFGIVLELKMKIQACDILFIFLVRGRCVSLCHSLISSIISMRLASLDLLLTEAVVASFSVSKHLLYLDLKLIKSLALGRNRMGNIIQPDRVSFPFLRCCYSVDTSPRSIPLIFTSLHGFNSLQVGLAFVPMAYVPDLWARALAEAI